MPQKDGSLLAEFRLSSVEEIKHWLLGFGGKALVLEPTDLRQEIAAELREMLAIYGPLLSNDAEPLHFPPNASDAISAEGDFGGQSLPITKPNRSRESRNKK